LRYFDWLFLVRQTISSSIWNDCRGTRQVRQITGRIAEISLKMQLTPVFYSAKGGQAIDTRFSGPYS
jgi:hypothetical protein